MLERGSILSDEEAWEPESKLELSVKSTWLLGFCVWLLGEPKVTPSDPKGFRSKECEGLGCMYSVVEVFQAPNQYWICSAATRHRVNITYRVAWGKQT